MVALAENKILKGGGGYNADAETQNYYVRNGYYAAHLGRWLTRDPIGYQGGINLYEYVQSSPVANVDPEGLFFIAGPAWPSGYNPVQAPGQLASVGVDAWQGFASWFGKTTSEVGQLLAPAENYLLNTLTYPGDKLLGLPTHPGLRWGQGSLDVGLIKESTSFQRQDNSRLQWIVSRWSMAHGCASAKGKIHKGLVFSASLFKPGHFLFDMIGQMTIGRFTVHAFAVGPIHQRCGGRGVVGGATLTVRYTVIDPFHLHLAKSEPGQFVQVIHWTGSVHIPIDRKC